MVVRPPERETVPRNWLQQPPCRCMPPWAYGMFRRPGSPPPASPCEPPQPSGSQSEWQSRWPSTMLPLTSDQWSLIDGPAPSAPSPLLRVPPSVAFLARREVSPLNRRKIDRTGTSPAWGVPQRTVHRTFSSEKPRRMNGGVANGSSSTSTVPKCSTMRWRARRASSRASGAPMQKCVPQPNARCCRDTRTSACYTEADH